MSITTLAQRVGAAAARLGRWALHRLDERTTWAGFAIILGAFGRPDLAAKVTDLGNAAIPALTALGALLVAVETKRRAAALPAPAPAPTVPLETLVAALAATLPDLLRAAQAAEAPAEPQP